MEPIHAVSIRDFKERFLRIDPDTPDNLALQAVHENYKKRVLQISGSTRDDETVSMVVRESVRTAVTTRDESTLLDSFEAAFEDMALRRRLVLRLRALAEGEFIAQGWPQFFWKNLVVTSWPQSTLSGKGFKVVIQGFCFKGKTMTKASAHQSVKQLQDILQKSQKSLSLQSCQLRKKNNPFTIQFVFGVRLMAHAFAEAFHEVGSVKSAPRHNMSY